MPDPLATVPLGALRVFEAAARQGSFTLAAQELGMTQAAVSWQVKALERRLDQTLFQRLPRGVALTPAGERLKRGVTEAMRLLRDAISDLSDAGAAALAITTLPTVAAQWLAPRLGGFHLAHPGIAVRLETSVRLADLVAEDVDVAIRAGGGAWPELEAIRLFPSLITALCTPDFAASLDLAKGCAALLDAPRIGLDAEWAHWFAAAGVAVSEATPDRGLPRFAADAQIHEIAASEAGQGAALASPIMFAAEIASGRLVQPFDVTLELPGGLWLVYPKARRQNRKIRAFRDWLLACVASDRSIIENRAQGSPG